VEQIEEVGVVRIELVDVRSTGRPVEWINELEHRGECSEKSADVSQEREERCLC
jgi:hypothetical protein